MKSPNNNLPESQDNGSQPKKFRKVNDGNSEKVQPIKSLEFKSSGKKQLKEDQKFQDKSKKFKKKEGLQEKVENEEDLNFNSEDGKNMILITKMNKLATKLFDKKIKDNTEKVKIIENILKKLGPLLPKLINKRNASKFIQACYKFGSLVQRNRIFDSLKTADLSEIFKSKYGHFLLMKVVKKGTKEQKNKLFDEIVKNAWFFASHKVIVSFYFTYNFISLN